MGVVLANTCLLNMRPFKRNPEGDTIPGGPKNGTVDFQDFALINSYLFSPCWI